MKSFSTSGGALARGDRIPRGIQVKSGFSQMVGGVRKRHLGEKSMGWFLLCFPKQEYTVYTWKWRPMDCCKSSTTSMDDVKIQMLNQQNLFPLFWIHHQFLYHRRFRLEPPFHLERFLEKETHHLWPTGGAWNPAEGKRQTFPWWKFRWWNCWWTLTYGKLQGCSAAAFLLDTVSEGCSGSRRCCWESGVQV